MGELAKIGVDVQLLCLSVIIELYMHVFQWCVHVWCCC